MINALLDSTCWLVLEFNKRIAYGNSFNHYCRHLIWFRTNCISEGSNCLMAQSHIVFHVASMTFPSISTGFSWSNSSSHDNMSAYSRTIPPHTFMRPTLVLPSSVITHSYLYTKDGLARQSRSAQQSDSHNLVAIFYCSPNCTKKLFPGTGQSIHLSMFWKRR